MNMAKTLDEYLALPYTIEIIPDQGAWFARIKELPGCMTQADSFEDLGEMIKDAMRSWLEVALEMGQTIPEPAPKEEYSGKFVVRMPRSLHRQLVETAEHEGVSLNQLVNVALAQMVGRTSSGTQVSYPISEKLSQRIVAEKK